MHEFKTLLLGCVSIGISACATVTTPTPAPPAVEVTTESPVPAQPTGADAPVAKTKPSVPAKTEVVPNTKLTAEMLFRLLTAEIAGQRGNIDLAISQYAAAARLTQEPRVVERATRISVYGRNDKVALEMAELWVKLEPDNVDAHQVAAAMFIRSGKVKPAKLHLERVIALSDQGAQKGFMLVSALLSKEKDKNTALGVMQELIADRQNDPDALYAYSQLALMVGDLGKAHEAVNKVLVLRPKMTDAQILNSTVLFRQGNKVEAFTALQQAVDADPNNHALRQYYARRLVDEKRYADARVQYKALLKQTPDDQESRYALGLLAMQLHDLKDAERYFRSLVDKQQMESESYFYLGQIAETRNDFDAAVTDYTAVSGGQHLLEAQIRIAMIDARRGNVKAARERIHSIPADTTELEERLLLAEGEILREAKLNQEAYEFYNEALTKQPDNNQLLYARALAAEKVEHIDVTLADLETIVKRDPNNAQALNALGYTLIDRTDKLTEGMQYITKAYKLQPDDPAILDSLGWANYRLGNYAEALKFLRIAFNKLKDAEVAAHLGEVLWVSGEKEAARHIWDEALRDTPNHKVLQDVIKRFIK
jgi:tetratricopeptide (TPR) repeat protein